MAQYLTSFTGGMHAPVYNQRYREEHVLPRSSFDLAFRTSCHIVPRFEQPLLSAAVACHPSNFRVLTSTP